MSQAPEAMALAIDASVALKWVLDEPDSLFAQRLAQGDEDLLLPDFWLAEATNICWLQVRKGRWSAKEAREALDLLQAQAVPTTTGPLALHHRALEIGLAVNHSPYDTLYVAFAEAIGARALVVADAPFVAAMRRHPDPALQTMLIPLEEWAREHGMP